MDAESLIGDPTNVLGYNEDTKSFCLDFKESPPKGTSGDKKFLIEFFSSATCANTRNHRDILKYHALEIDKRGVTVNDDPYPGKKGEDYFAKRIGDILHGFAEYKKEWSKIKFLNPNLPDAKLLIFAHGGLNSRRVAHEQVVEQTALLRADGYYPIFLIWRTSALETYWEQVAHVRTGEVEDSPSLTTPLYITGDFGQGVARAPVNFKNQVKRFWRSEIDRDKEFVIDKDAAVGNSANKESLYYNVTLSKNFTNEREITTESALEDALYAALMPARIATTFFVDPLGTTAWENMVRRAMTGIHSANEFKVCDGKEGNPADEKLCERLKSDRKNYPHGTGGFSKLFQTLESCMTPEQDAPSSNQAGGAAVNKGAARPRPPCTLKAEQKAALQKGVKVTLVGHSMGTIVFNQLASLYSDIPYEKIIYMAAAANIRHFTNAITPLMRSNPGLSVHSLMLHPLAESRERFGGGIAPSGSLLEWIDEMYEPSVTPLDRTLGKWRNVRLAKHIFEEDIRDKIHFKIFGFSNADPTKHGDFNDTRFLYWRSEFWCDGLRSNSDSSSCNIGELR
ncbi:MAG: hypothetical protein FJ311_07745 [Rhodospirillales bacterium]|nr:hypothetical protein [Rhodospirillales bacterium]